MLAKASAAETAPTVRAPAKRPRTPDKPTTIKRVTPVTSAEANRESSVTASGKRRYFMPAVVLGLLGGHMIFIVTAITLGTGDPSFAVVPDYYSKAVDYDEHKALLAESEALGWSVQLTPADAVDAIGQRELVVQLRDREGQPVHGLTVRVEAYHMARANQLVTLECVEVLPGQYVGQGRLGREGFWQYAVEAVSPSQRFAADVKQYVSAAEVAR